MNEENKIQSHNDNDKDGFNIELIENINVNNFSHENELD